MVYDKVWSIFSREVYVEETTWVPRLSSITSPAPQDDKQTPSQAVPDVSNTTVARITPATAKRIESNVTDDNDC